METLCIEQLQNCYEENTVHTHQKLLEIKLGSPQIILHLYYEDEVLGPNKKILVERAGFECFVGLYENTFTPTKLVK